MHVYVQKNDYILSDYFEKRNDWESINSKECAYQHADAIFARNIDISMVKKGKILFNQGSHFDTWKNIAELRMVLKLSDHLKAFDFGSEFLGEAKSIDCRERAWASTQEVDFIRDENGTSQEQGPWIIKSELGQKNKIYSNFSEMIEQLRLYKGRVKETFLLQQYVPNPILLDNKKIDFKVFMLVVSSDPLIILYKEGYARVNSLQYDPENMDSIQCKRTNTEKISTHGYSCEIYEYIVSNFDQKNISQLIASYSFSELNELLKKQYDVSSQALNKVQERFKAALAYIIVSTKHQLQLKKNYIALLECTFVVDDTLNVHLINIKDNYTPKELRSQLRNYYSELVEDWLDLGLKLYENRFVWKREYRNYCRKCSSLFNEDQQFEYVNYLRTYDGTQFKSKRKPIQKIIDDL